MYNLVLLKNNTQYVTSVFDQKDNEMWNNETYLDLAIRELVKKRFVFNNVLFDDGSIYLLAQLTDLNFFQPATKIINVEDILLTDERIANEVKTTQGYARYIHRMFLK